MVLQHEIEQLFHTPQEQLDRARALQLFNEFKFFLNRGEIRAAEKVGGAWKVNTWVKQGILLGFRLGILEDVSINAHFKYFDRSTFPLKRMSVSDGIRVVPGGSAIRDGAYVGKGVVCMPPMYINAGAYVDDETMIDSHALVGSCAQVGKRVHLSAGAQIGGVLEPVGALPVVVEDDVLVGGNCGVYDGTLVQHSAVLGAGVILTRGTPVYDTVRAEIYRASADEPLVIPSGAVVVPGARPLPGEWPVSHHLCVSTPVIVKYRDGQTDAATALEAALR